MGERASAFQFGVTNCISSTYSETKTTSSLVSTDNCDLRASISRCVLEKGRWILSLPFNKVYNNQCCVCSLN